MAWGDGRWGSSTWGTGISDLTPPVLQNRIPIANQINVPGATTVQVEVVDDGSLVVSASVELYVNGVLAWQNDANQNGFVTVKTVVTNGFRYVITPPTDFAGGSTATIQVIAENQDTLELNTSYQFFMAETSPPLIVNIKPGNGQVDVAVDTTLAFDLYDPNGDYDPTTVQVIVNDIVVYSSQAQQNGHTVTVSPITQGEHFLVVFPQDFSLNAVVMCLVFAEDMAGNGRVSQFSFQTVKQLDCFAGPSNATEAAILGPYLLAETKLRNMESIRRDLLAAASTTGNPTESARAMYLRAFLETELAPVLNNLVTPPSDDERNVRLCNKVTMMTVSNALRRKGNRIPAALNELRTIGLPDAHYALLKSYTQVDEPGTEVPFACFLVFLAKALESTPGVA